MTDYNDLIVLGYISPKVPAYGERQFTRMLYQVIFRPMSLLCDLFVCAQHLDEYHKKPK